MEQPVNGIIYGKKRAPRKWKGGSGEERFWDKVNKNGPVPEHCPEIENCWVWTGCTMKNGYGHLRYLDRDWLAHHFIFFVEGCDIPNGMIVCHSCDNPSCVRWSHLWLGTHKENMRDCMSKSRFYNNNWSIGERNGNAKLAESQVREILFLFRQGMPLKILVERFNSKRSTIDHIVHRRTWKNINLWDTEADA